MVLVYDFGGGTFDVSLVDIGEVNGSLAYTVQASRGDPHLGGKDVDDIIFQRAADAFKLRYGKDPRDDAKALRKLREECSAAKEALGTSQSYEMELELMKEDDFTFKITRGEFDEWIEPVMQKTLDCVKGVLQDVNFDKGRVHQVILVGGSTRIAKVSSMLEDFFGKPPCKTVDPDEAVAMGAALAPRVGSRDGSARPPLVLNDVTPLGLGILCRSRSGHSYIENVIPRNTNIPTTCVKSDFQTPYDNCTHLTFDVC